MTRLLLMGALGVGVYAVAASAPSALGDPLALTALALAAAFFGAAVLRPAGEPRARAATRTSVRGPSRMRRPTGFEMLGRAAVSLTLWAAVAGAIVLALSDRPDISRAALSTAQAPVPLPIPARHDQTTVLTREHGGHFVATARVNGQPVRMLVDTGSSDVALPFDEALRLGVNVDRLVFDSPVMTANGQAMVAPVILPTVSVGAIVLNDVRASVAEPGKLGSALLGMSFLGHLSEVSLRGETLLLRQ